MGAATTIARHVSSVRREGMMVMAEVYNSLVWMFVGENSVAW